MIDLLYAVVHALLGKQAVPPKMSVQGRQALVANTQVSQVIPTLEIIERAPKESVIVDLPDDRNVFHAEYECGSLVKVAHRRMAVNDPDCPACAAGTCVQRFVLHPGDDDIYVKHQTNSELN